MFLGRKQLSGALLILGMIMFLYMTFLTSVSSHAQMSGGPTRADAQNSDCPGAREVSTIRGNGDKQSPVFSTIGTSFRLNVDSTATSETPQDAGLTVYAYPEGDNVDFAGVFAVEEGRDDSSIVNAGPGRFYLDIVAANVDYTVTVEDCTGSSQGEVSTSQIESSTSQIYTEQFGNQERQLRVETGTIPNKPLPPTGGGSPAAFVVAGCLLTGAALLGLRTVMRRK